MAPSLFDTKPSSLSSIDSGQNADQRACVARLWITLQLVALKAKSMFHLQQIKHNEMRSVERQTKINMTFLINLADFMTINASS